MKRRKSKILSKLPKSVFQPLLLALKSKLAILNAESKDGEKNEFDKHAGLITHAFFHQTLGVTNDKAILADIAFWQWLNKKLAKLTLGRFPDNYDVRMGIELSDVRKINFRNQYEYVCSLHDNTLKDPYEYAKIETAYDMKYSMVATTKTLQRKNPHIMKVLVEAHNRPKNGDAKMQRDEMRNIIHKINSSPSNQNNFANKSQDECYRMLQQMRKPPKPISAKQTERVPGKKPGFVYVFKNPSFANQSLLKIGETKNIVERINALSSTSVPEPFEPLFCVPSDDCKKLEKAVHEKLKKYRTKKEFFDVDIETAIETIMELR